MGEPADLAHLTAQKHIPVLLREVLDGLGIFPGGRYIDATVGAGGHTAAALERSAPDGCVLGLDRDPKASAAAAARLEPFGSRACVVHASYDRLEAVAQEKGFVPADGVLFDLGFSSLQVEDPERGFAFRLEGPLDMRFDPLAGGPTAADLLNRLSEEEVAALLWRYGEEPQSRRIARAIMEARPFYTTRQLAEVVTRALGRTRGHIHPATRTFQALRIAVNRELELLEVALPQAVSVLRTGGRLAIITFHSLEDRLVKQFFKEQAQGCTCPPEVPICTCGHQPVLRLVTRRSVTASAEEIAANPRSRSARLRVAEKIN